MQGGGNCVTLISPVSPGLTRGPASFGQAEANKAGCRVKPGKAK